MAEEQWKAIHGFENYEVSDHGNIKRKNGTFLKQALTHKKQLCVTLMRNKKRVNVTVHRIVAFAFVPNPDKKPNVTHLNNNNLDNRASNLSWQNHQETLNKSLENKRAKKAALESENKVQD